MIDVTRSIAAALLLAAGATTAAEGQPAHAASHAAGGQPDSAWTAAPLLLKAPGRSRSVALFKPLRVTQASVTALPATESGEGEVAIEVPMEGGKAAVRPRGKRQGGWYRVVAESADGRVRAGSVVYFSNPGPAPRHMLHSVRPGLDLSPAELPREHRKYRAGETWGFTLRQDGQPLPDREVLFETASGVHQVLRTDAQGVVQLTFPDDFAATPASGDHSSHAGEPSTGFALSAHVSDAGGGTRLAAFNHAYYPNEYDGKSLWLGSGFALFGMIAALPLVTRRAPREVRS